MDRVTGRVKAWSRGLVPLDVAEARDRAGQMTGGVIAVVAAVVMRRGADVPGAELAAGFQPAGETVAVDVILDYVHQAVARPVEQRRRGLALAVGNQDGEIAVLQPL